MNPHDILLQGTNGKAVLLVHGLTGAPNEMSFIAKRLHKQGYTVYVPTLAGHCQDKAALMATGWRDWYQSVDEAWQLLHKDYTDIYAAGICAGGSLALYLAAQRPEALKAVVLYSITFRYDGWNIPVTANLIAWFPFLTDIWPFKHMAFAEKHPFGIKNDRVRTMITRSDMMKDCLPFFPYPILRRMYQLNDAVKAKLPQISTPTLTIHAKEDDVSHLRNAECITRLIGGKNELHLLHDSYHLIHVDQERQQVADLTAQYFSNSHD